VDAPKEVEETGCAIRRKQGKEKRWTTKTED
jgi:hypothetical protein